MKRSLCMGIAVLTLGVLAGCSHPGGEASPAPSEKAAQPEGRVKHGTNGEVVITLDAATRKLMGLETVSLVATQLSAQIKGFGRVLDTAPLGDLIIELGKAELEFDNSHADLERMKVLKGQDNTSEKAFQASENLYRQNQMAVSAVLNKLKNTWGGKLAEMTGPMVVPVGTVRKWDAVLEQVLEGQNALVRVDFNPTEHVEPGNALVVPLKEAGTPTRARFFDTARTVDPQTQGQGLLFLVEENVSNFAPGTALTAFMDATHAPSDGVVIPRSAIVHFNGATWAYLQTGEDTYERTELSLESPLADGWFVKGFKAGGNVVSVGAQQLLSEELRSQGGED